VLRLAVHITGITVIIAEVMAVGEEDGGEDDGEQFIEVAFKKVGNHLDFHNTRYFSFS